MKSTFDLNFTKETIQTVIKMIISGKPVSDIEQLIDERRDELLVNKELYEIIGDHNG